ncbi:hypothetical protein CPB85DRAFT_1439086 [Mucidula mucida]|nr:hypothetical protein CPB85DRAFT_1439086 [Mucidula mucida]
MFVKKLTQVKKLSLRFRKDKSPFYGGQCFRRKPSRSILASFWGVLVARRQAWLEEDPLLLHLNLDDLPSDLPVFGASRTRCMNAALKCFLMRYRDLILLTPNEINRRIHVGGKGSSFSWVMDRLSELGFHVFVLLDNLHAPLLKSTEDNIDEIHTLLNRYLIYPLEASIRTGPIGATVA